MIIGDTNNLLPSAFVRCSKNDFSIRLSLNYVYVSYMMLPQFGPTGKLQSLQCHLFTNNNAGQVLGNGNGDKTPCR